MRAAEQHETLLDKPARRERNKTWWQLPTPIQIMDEPASQPVGLLRWPATGPMINPGFPSQIFAASLALVLTASFFTPQPETQRASVSRLQITPLHQFRLKVCLRYR